MFFVAMVFDSRLANKISGSIGRGCAMSRDSNIRRIALPVESRSAPAALCTAHTGSAPRFYLLQLQGRIYFCHASLLPFHGVDLSPTTYLSGRGFWHRAVLLSETVYSLSFSGFFPAASADFGFTVGETVVKIYAGSMHNVDAFERKATGWLYSSLHFGSIPFDDICQPVLVNIVHEENLQAGINRIYGSVTALGTFWATLLS